MVLAIAGGEYHGRTKHRVVARLRTILLINTTEFCFTFHDLSLTKQENLPLFSGTMLIVDWVVEAASFCTSFRVKHGKNLEQS